MEARLADAPLLWPHRRLLIATGGNNRCWVMPRGFL